ncbi:MULTISPECIES: hypothetical protein [unclassified Gilliamella]|uniref:hypothetical protein n=1 Tax=unclassified Gilliamella TaxID=2685620 RepID=UPI001146EB40|nr:hypothetical protein [Gilliamella apicola]
MFDEFQSKSLKVIRLYCYLFGLIASYNMQVIIVPNELATILNRNLTVNISCGDAVMICETIDAYHLDVDRAVDIIELELNDE